ncbi:cyclin family protein [Skeletonema marinoi]|uniref:Cyclin family protein n=1 Tax=Skeletonema marinoi TaxID=267567 RepID=A0AAD8YIE8_9STRA|nr:cyclin family protein [Skeletonema marinoi]
MFHHYDRKESDILSSRERVSSMEFDSLIYHRGQSPEDFMDNMDEDHPMDEQDDCTQRTAAVVTPDRQGCHHNTQRQQTPSAPSHHIEELQISTAEHILALLQREANDYSTPLPVKYYPIEFDDDTNKSSSGKSTKIGPWRKRIASWMYDVVDHFSYDRNIVNISLRYIDQYVSYLLANSSRVGSQVVKRRHFQLIAVTSLYLAIKIHGELLEDDPISGERFDMIESLLAEVDGFGLFKGAPKKATCNGDDGEESDDDLQALSDKILDLRRKQRLGRLHLGFGFGSFGAAAPVSTSEPPVKPHSNIPYKNRRRGMLSGPLRLHSFVELSRGLFTAEDITDTERKILKSLNYVVSVPTSRRFVGEMIRMMAVTSSPSGAGTTLAEVGLDRYDFLSNVLTTACHQIEGASSVPELSIGSLPSTVAYAAVLNAFEDEVQKHLNDMNVVRDASQHSLTYSDNGRNMVGSGSYQLEDFQRHYRRYSRSQSPSTPMASIKKQLLETWREQFLLAIFHGTNCFLTPDSEEVSRVRVLLLDSKPTLKDSGLATTTRDAAAEAPLTISTTSATKKRSPRSPTSVIPRVSVSSSRTFSGNSFFSRHASSGEIGTSDASAPPPPRSSSARVRINKEYFKQVSEPIQATRHHSHVSSVRASTPDNLSAARLAAERELSNYESWRSEAFQPPPFFSA